jgi:hypothetical protein
VRDRVRAELGSLAPLVALSGFAIAQPVLDVLGRNPELIAFRGAGGLDLWAVGLLFVVVPPLVLWLVELVVGLVVPVARRPLHLAFVALLAAGLGAQVGARVVGLDGVLLSLTALLVGAAVAAVARRPIVRLWLSYAAWAPLLFLVLFAGLSPAAGATRGGRATVEGVTVTKPVRVVMVVLDELPVDDLLAADGTIDRSLYPGFAELADGSHWFRAASAVSNATPYAVPAILTGKLPPDKAQPLVSDYPDNLFTLLGGAYRMAVAESVTRLCPAALCDPAGVEQSAVRSLVGDGTRVWKEQVELSAGSDPLATFAEPGGVGDEGSGLEEPLRFQALLRSLDGSPTRTLHFAHLVLPHTPSRYLPSGRSYPQPAADLGPFWEEPGRFFDLWTTDAWQVAVGRQRAVLQTQYVDRLVHTLVTTLKDKGLWDDTLVVVTADHGRAFQAGLPARGLDAGADPTPVLPELMGVPLFVHVPGERQPVVDDANVQTIDVLPTIADVLGVDVPWKVDGTSALAEGARPATKVMHQQVRSSGASTKAGPTFTVPAATFLAKVRARGVDRFLPATGPLRVAQVGPGADLVGRKVTAAMASSASSADATLHDPDAFDDVDPTGNSVPVFVSGEVHGGTGDVAVVVNGTIAGVSTRFDWARRTGVFQVMVPESLLHAGRNQLQLYLVDARGRLHPLTL